MPGSSTSPNNNNCKDEKRLRQGSEEFDGEIDALSGAIMEPNLH